MAIPFLYIILLIFNYSHRLCRAADPKEWLEITNSEMQYLNRLAANITWLALIGDQTVGGGDEVAELRTRWRNAKCDEAFSFGNLKPMQARMVYLLCRGPKYTVHQSKFFLSHLGAMSRIYIESKICRHENQCYSMEPDLDNLMRESRDPAELLWAWTSWRAAVGPKSLLVYPSLIHIQNQAAKNNGYSDIGECWREELETPDLKNVVENLYQEISPFYKLLHAFVRYKLANFYGETNVPLQEPIPAHLLGNMWGQSWESLMDIVMPETILDLDKELKKKARNVKDILKKAEEFYLSMGFPPMTQQFWQYSKITKELNDSTTCHGTAADLFVEDEYRMLVCASIKWEDFYVITHEMGHIEYFMAYKHQPTIFKDGANSAVQEAIGDTIMLALESPKNLKRIGIIPNTSEDITLALLLRQALKSIPKLPFGIVMDKWRWDVMASVIPSNKYNKMWWYFRTNYQGVQPPIPRGKYDFDAASKYHIADNTPFIRYFLSEFLQYQLLDVLCKDQQHLELRFCDLYGAKEAGKKLRNFLKQGSSKPWYTLFEELSDGKYKTYSAQPLLKYFSPLITWLENQIEKYKIPVGW